MVFTPRAEHPGDHDLHAGRQEQRSGCGGDMARCKAGCVAAEEDGTALGRLRRSLGSTFAKLLAHHPGQEAAQRACASRQTFAAQEFWELPCSIRP
jgi:hypothetical protein